MKRYSVAEAADACQLTTSMIYRAIEAGQLKATATEKKNKRDKWQITEEDLLTYKRWRVTKHGDYYPELDALG